MGRTIVGARVIGRISLAAAYFSGKVKKTRCEIFLAAIPDEMTMQKSRRILALAENESLTCLISATRR